MNAPNKCVKKGLIRSIANLLYSHFCLFTIELEEAKNFVLVSVVHMAIIAIGGLLFCIIGSIGVMAYFWDSYRLTAILALLGIYLLIILISFINLGRINRKTKLFASLKEELAKDKEELLS